MPRKPYSTDVSDEEWSFAAPYLTLMDQHAPQQIAHFLLGRQCTLQLTGGELAGLHQQLSEARTRAVVRQYGLGIHGGFSIHGSTGLGDVWEEGS